MLKEGTSHSAKRVFNSKAKKDPWPKPQPVTVDSEGELEGYIPVPNFKQSFSDAVAVALEKANLTQGNF